MAWQLWQLQDCQCVGLTCRSTCLGGLPATTSANDGSRPSARKASTVGDKLLHVTAPSYGHATPTAACSYISKYLHLILQAFARCAGFGLSSSASTSASWACSTCGVGGTCLATSSVATASDGATVYTRGSGLRSRPQFSSRSPRDFSSLALPKPLSLPLGEALGFWSWGLAVGWIAMLTLFALPVQDCGVLSALCHGLKVWLSCRNRLGCGGFC